MRHRFGFTLIELLIVITIISILMLAGITVYTNFLQNARDTRRQADLKFIQSGLEQYFADQKYYPTKAQVPFGGTLASPDGKKTYLTTIPNDPTKNPDYSYQVMPKDCDNTPTKICTNYCLYSNLENMTLPNSPDCQLTGDYKYSLSKP